MLRVAPGGTKTFFFRYQRSGQVDRLMIGHYPMTTLRVAYEAHADFQKALNRAEDPRLAKRALSLTEPSVGEDGTSVGDLAQEFLKRYVYIERKRPKEAEQVLEANVLKTWRTRSAGRITRRDAVLLLDQIVDRGAPIMANRVAALLVQMFQFGVERGILDASPLVALPRPGGREKGRSRKLDEREIRLFWRRLRHRRITAILRLALKLVLVTAQRPGEVAGAARAEFDLEKRLWTIPAERSKNGEAHVVPLSLLAITLLRHLSRLTGETEFILPTRCWRLKGSAPLTVRALSQAIRDNAKHLKIDHFTPHDLRRTAASRMTALGVPRLHVEKILNHTIDDVAEIYDRHDYIEEKRAALEKWEMAIWRILKSGSSNILALRSSSSARSAS
jgi:integrase